MYNQEIETVKIKMQDLQDQGLLSAWELPYENILTRLTAAAFFIEAKDEFIPEIKTRLQHINGFSLNVSDSELLSKLRFRVTFGKE